MSVASSKSRSSVRILILTLAAVTVVGVLTGLLPGAAGRLHHFGFKIPFQIHAVAHLTTVVSGFCLLSLIHGLLRRKRTAWALSCLALAVSILAHLLRGLEWEQAMLSAVTLAWLAARQDDFQARSDPPSVAQGIRLLGGSLLFVISYGSLGYWLLDRHYGSPATLSSALVQTLSTLAPGISAAPLPVTRFGVYFTDSMVWLGSLGLVASLAMLLRPILLRRPASPEELTRARQIVSDYGASSLAFFTLLPDKHYFFSPAGSLLAYGVHGRAAVVLGDPIGPDEDRAAAVTAFQELCRGNDWSPAFLQVPPESLALYRQLGFSVVGLGEEAVVDVTAFSLAGGRYASMRSALKRLQREGYTTQLYEPPLSDEILARLRAVSDAWLEQQAGREKGFTMGWFYDDYLRASRVLAAISPQGRVEAFANLVPEYQRNELTLDLMRRLPDSAPGTMEFLFVRLFELSKQEGYDSFSLGLSPLVGVGDDPEDPLAEKLLHFIYENFDRFYHFEGLHRFKQKFAPEWSPRYLAYLPSGLPEVTQAVIRLNSGDDFLWRQSIDYLRQILWPPAYRTGGAKSSSP